MNSILITGSNRGIGLGLVRHLLQHPTSPKYLLAVCRNPEKAQELQDLTKLHKNLYILKLEMTDFEKFNEFTAEVESIVKNDGLNVLINNAGIATKFTRVNQVKMDQMLENFKVNALAPLMLTKMENELEIIKIPDARGVKITSVKESLLPVLKKATNTNSTEQLGIKRAVILNISSVLGSIATNTDGGFYPYRASKAALNAITKSLSLDLKNDGILVTSMHPGWVQTEMGGPKAPMSVEESVSAIVNTLLNLNESHNGSFIQFDGKQLSW